MALFVSAGRFRAGPGLYGLGKLIETNAFPDEQSNEGTVALAAVPIVTEESPRGTTGLVVLNRTGRSGSVLIGNGDGGLFNPQPSLTFPSGTDPTAVVAARFERSNPNLDLAVLDPTLRRIFIFRGDGAGGFVELGSVDAGNSPTGLSVVDVNGDKLPDLVVGNQFGDVLILPGNGDGTFQPFRRSDENTGLTVIDPQHFLFTDPAHDTVTVKDPLGTITTFEQERAQGVQAPAGAAVMNVGGGEKAFIVANSGGNDVLVYLFNTQGALEPVFQQAVSVGTEPVSVSTGEITNADGTQTPVVMVANKGSNDVSILTATGTGPTFMLTEGARLTVGQGPVAAMLATINGAQQLVATDSVSNDVRLLPSRGNGFFSDVPGAVTILPTGLTPVQTFVGDFNGVPDLLTLNSGSNDLTLFSDFTGPGMSVSFGGDLPVDAVEANVTLDGLSDLFIANEGNGTVTFLDGLSPLATFSSADVPHPTALALVEVGGLTNVYVCNEGQEQAVLLTSFSLGLVPGLPAGSAIPPTAGEAGAFDLSFETTAGVEDITPVNEGPPAVIQVAAAIPVNQQKVGGGDLETADVLDDSQGSESSLDRGMRNPGGQPDAAEPDRQRLADPDRQRPADPDGDKNPGPDDAARIDELFSRWQLAGTQVGDGGDSLTALPARQLGQGSSKKPALSPLQGKESAGSRETESDGNAGTNPAAVTAGVGRQGKPPEAERPGALAGGNEAVRPDSTPAKREGPGESWAASVDAWFAQLAMPLSGDQDDRVTGPAVTLPANPAACRSVLLDRMFALAGAGLTPAGTDRPLTSESW